MDFLYAMILRNLGSILAALIIAAGAFFAAREGGRIAGESSRESVRETLEGQRQLDKHRQEEIVDGVLQAFYGELNIFWERLNEIVQDCWKEYEEAMMRLKHVIRNTDECEVPLRLGGLNTSIRFVKTHFQDIRTILEEQE